MSKINVSINKEYLVFTRGLKLWAFICHTVGARFIISTSKTMFYGLFSNTFSKTKFHRVEQKNGHEKNGNNVACSRLRLL
jgi:hypothetical protein